MPQFDSKIFQSNHLKYVHFFKGCLRGEFEVSWGVENRGSLSARNSLGNRLGRAAESRVLIPLERKLHLPLNAYRSPPHLLRIVALPRQPDLHGECTYGLVYRGPYEKRDARPCFSEKRTSSRARVRPFHREFYSAGAELHRNVARLFARPLDLDSPTVQVNLATRSFY